jgi:hypothetical protein
MAVFFLNLISGIFGFGGKIAQPLLNSFYGSGLEPVSAIGGIGFIITWPLFAVMFIVDQLRTEPDQNNTTFVSVACLIWFIITILLTLLFLLGFLIFTFPY